VYHALYGEHNPEFIRHVFDYLHQKGCISRVPLLKQAQAAFSNFARKSIQ
jgi:hypothetical protein